MLDLVATFEANGMIKSYMELLNLKRNYYTGNAGYIRFACEILFVLLLIFYFIMEILEIVDDIKEK